MLIHSVYLSQWHTKLITALGHGLLAGFIHKNKMQQINKAIINICLEPYIEAYIKSLLSTCAPPGYCRGNEDSGFRCALSLQLHQQSTSRRARPATWCSSTPWLCRLRSRAWLGLAGPACPCRGLPSASAVVQEQCRWLCWNRSAESKVVIAVLECNYASVTRHTDW